MNKNLQVLGYQLRGSWPSVTFIAFMASTWDVRPLIKQSLKKGFYNWGYYGFRV